MVEVGIIPESSASKFRYDVKAGVSEKGAGIKEQDADKEAIERLLEADLGRTFSPPFEDIPSLLNRNSFAVFDGDVNKLLGAIDSRESVDFLMVNYIGKMPNRLVSAYSGSDLSTIAFFSRLNNAARLMAEVTNKKARVVVAIENMFFERNILALGGKSIADSVYKDTASLIRDFGFENISLEPMESFLGKEFMDTFSSCLEGFSRNREVVKNGDGFERLFDVFYFSYPTDSLEDAVDAYSNRKE